MNVIIQCDFISDNVTLYVKMLLLILQCYFILPNYNFDFDFMIMIFFFSLCILHISHILQLSIINIVT